MKCLIACGKVDINIIFIIIGAIAKLVANLLKKQN